MGTIGVTSQKMVPRAELVRMVQRISQLPPEKPSSDFDITANEAVILDALCERPSLTRNELKAATGLSCSPEICELIERGLIYEHKRQPRAALLSVTAKGRAAAATPQMWALL